MTEELTARQARLSALTRAMRELDTQRILMGAKGSKKEVVTKTKYAEGERQLPSEAGWGFDDGKKSGKKGLPEAEAGLNSGARVWVSAGETMRWA